MRVLHIVESFGGGVLSAVSQACNVLKEENIDVHVAYSIRPDTPANYELLFRDGVVFHELKLSREINPLKDVAGMFSILTLIANLRPTVVHLHSSKAGFLGRVAASLVKLVLPKMRVFYSPHGFSFQQYGISKRKKKFYTLIEALGSKSGGILVACSRGELRKAKRLIGVKQAVLLENAVDTETIPVKTEGGPGFRIGTVGRLTEQKNPKMFLEVAKQFSSDVNFVWIGGGEKSDELLFEEVPNARVTGWRTREEALEALRTLDIYIHTSHGEGMPLAVIEAMVAGVPAIVTNVTGNRDVVQHGVTGVLVRTADEMVAALCELMNDKTKCEMMGFIAREIALNRFNMQRYKQQLLTIYGVDSPGNA